MKELERTSSLRITPDHPVHDTADAENDFGWGFADTRFEVLANGHVVLTGDRYNLCGFEIPGLLSFWSRLLGVTLSPTDQRPPNRSPPIPKPKDLTAFVREMKGVLGDDQLTVDEMARLRRGHGQTGLEIYELFYGYLPRIPDMVAFPGSDREVEALVAAANKCAVVLVPYGGGTNVTKALECPEDEQRPIVSVDMRRMNRILWIDAENGLARIQAGACGRSIIAQLAKHGFTIGHEPDSVEFSTLGGWIATNCSGMKKNRYGNIEDIVEDLSVVTSLGVVERFRESPRESVGIDSRRCFFGSEGALGIITSATVKLRRLPEATHYGSFIFKDFATGFAFLRQLERDDVVPASVRLMDHLQFQFGLTLKGVPSWWEKQKNTLGKLLLTKMKGIDLNECSLVTLVFEGTAREVAAQEKAIDQLARRCGGVAAGPENGQRGYNMTFGIAYLRDLAFQQHIIVESFETSVVWGRVLELCSRVQERCVEKHRELGLPGTPMFSYRVTQIYASGVCIYFYAGFHAKGVDSAIVKYAELEDALREEILACGGSLSHHHGVGKIRTRFLDQVQTGAMNEFNRRLKSAVDADNVFGCRNQGLGQPANARGSSGRSSSAASAPALERRESPGVALAPDTEFHT